jgi:hypothetical protein
MSDGRPRPAPLATRQRGERLAEPQVAEPDGSIPNARDAIYTLYMAY